MDNMLAIETRYREHQAQMAWLNEENWQFARPTKRYPVRQAVARALVALADAVAPAKKQETQTA
jgi:hypothetical protein